MTRRGGVGRVGWLVLMILLTVPGTLVGAAAASAAEPNGSLSFTPETGLDSYALTAVSTGTCADPRGSNLQLKVSGHGFAEGTNVTPNLPASIYPIDPARHGYDVPLQDTLRDFAAQQHPAAVLSGRYDFTLICKKPVGAGIFGSYTGSIWFTSPTHYTATRASGSSSSPTPTAQPGSGAVSGAATGPTATSAAARPTTPRAPSTATRSAASSPAVATTPVPAPTRSAGPPVASSHAAAPTRTASPRAPTSSSAQTTASVGRPTPAAGPASTTRVDPAGTLPVRAVSDAGGPRHHDRVSGTSVAILAALSVVAAALLGLFLRRRLSSAGDDG